MVELRKLREDDCNLIFSWISNPELRKMTGTRGEPDKESHIHWFHQKMMDTKNAIYMMMYEGVPVGLIGTNEINTLDKNANIYLYVGDNSYRKKGIAYQAVNQLIDILVAEYHCHKITATIRSYNEPSIHLFTKCGFVCEGMQKDQIIYDGEYYDRLLFGKIVT